MRSPALNSKYQGRVHMRLGTTLYAYVYKFWSASRCTCWPSTLLTYYLSSSPGLPLHPAGPALCIALPGVTLSSGEVAGLLAGRGNALAQVSQGDKAMMCAWGCGQGSRAYWQAGAEAPFACHSVECPPSGCVCSWFATFMCDMLYVCYMLLQVRGKAAASALGLQAAFTITPVVQVGGKSLALVLLH